MNEEEIIAVAAKAGAEAAMKKYQIEREKDEKQKKKRCFENTKLLLENYRALKEQSLKAVYRASQIEESAIDIISLMWDPFNRHELTINCIKQSAMRTYIMVSHIEEMLRSYKLLAEKSKTPEDVRRYGVIYDYYISDTALTIDEIASKYGIVSRSVYNDLTVGQNVLSALLYGVDWVLLRNNA